MKVKAEESQKLRILSHLGQFLSNSATAEISRILNVAKIEVPAKGYRCTQQKWLSVFYHRKIIKECIKKCISSFNSLQKFSRTPEIS